MCHTHTEIEVAYASEIEEREQELADWELEYAESEDYNNLTHVERMELEAAVDRYLDEREDREQEMLEEYWHKAEQEEQPVIVPSSTTTVTALIRNDSNQLLFVMGKSGEWELPWGPITDHDNHNAGATYTPHEVDSMMSLADMLLTTLGVRIASCQWVSTGVYHANGDDYEVTLVEYPEVDGKTTMWY